MDQFINPFLDAMSQVTRDTCKTIDQQAMVRFPLQATAEQTVEICGQMNRSGQGQRQRPRVEANINDPVTKVVGLILGTPEFQRQ